VTRRTSFLTLDVVYCTLVAGVYFASYHNSVSVMIENCFHVVLYSPQPVWSRQFFNDSHDASGSTRAQYQGQCSYSLDSIRSTAVCNATNVPAGTST